MSITSPFNQSNTPLQQAQQNNQQVRQQDQNQQQAAQPVQQPIQQVQQQSGQQISAGTGSSPEAPAIPVQQAEQAPAQVETGYEQIKQIEQAAKEQSVEKGEQVKEQKQKKQAPPQQSKPQKPAKKKPSIPQPKFFGYRPSPKLSNPKVVQAKAKRIRNTGSSETWLVAFLNYLLQKENAKA